MEVTIATVLWTVWQESKRRTFQGNSKEAMAIVDIVVSKRALRAAKCKEFQGYEAMTIMQSWDVVLKEDVNFAVLFHGVLLWIF